MCILASINSNDTVNAPTKNKKYKLEFRSDVNDKREREDWELTKSDDIVVVPLFVISYFTLCLHTLELSLHDIKKNLFSWVEYQRHVHCQCSILRSVFVVVMLHLVFCNGNYY